MKIAEIQADHFRIPLTTVLSDSTHGEMSYFELVTVRVRSKTGEEGLGYTYTTGVGGAAIHAMITKDLTPLMVDANMIWGVDHAIRAAGALADYDILWLEEPTIPDDIQGHAKIAREGGIPIATGENLHTIYEFQAMISQGGISFPEPDVATVGGVTPWLKIAHLAEVHNLPVTTHGVHDLQVHLLAAVSNASYLEVHGFGLERFTRYPFQLDDGEAIAPNRPGHGVALEWDALEPHRQKHL